MVTARLVSGEERLEHCDWSTAVLNTQVRTSRSCQRCRATTLCAPSTEVRYCRVTEGQAKWAPAPAARALRATWTHAWMYRHTCMYMHMSHVHVHAHAHVRRPCIHITPGVGLWACAACALITQGRRPPSHLYTCHVHVMCICICTRMACALITRGRRPPSHHPACRWRSRGAR